VDGHHLHVPLRKGLIRVLVLVDAAVVEQAQEAVEQMKAQELAIPVRDDGVVVVGLEDVENLREDGQVTRGVLVLHRAAERLQRQQAVEVVGRAGIEGVALFERLDTVCDKPIGGVEVCDFEDLIFQRTDAHAPEIGESPRICERVAALAALLEVEGRSGLDDVECDWSHRSDPSNGAEILNRSIQDAA
jgi:hypothetical protein